MATRAPEIAWQYRGKARKEWRCEACTEPSGPIYERMLMWCVILRCWKHGPGLDGRTHNTPAALRADLS